MTARALGKRVADLERVAIATQPATVVVTLGKNQGPAEALYLAMVRLEAIRPANYILRDENGDDLPQPERMTDAEWNIWLSKRLPLPLAHERNQHGKPENAHRAA
jgi:hypothetical protein